MDLRCEAYMKTLPFATQLIRRSRELYKELTCPACSGFKVENAKHLLECDYHVNKWQDVHEQLRAELLHLFDNKFKVALPEKINNNH